MKLKEKQIRYLINDYDEKKILVAEKFKLNNKVNGLTEMVIPKIDTSKNKIFEIEPSSNNRIFFI